MGRKAAPIIARTKVTHLRYFQTRPARPKEEEGACQCSTQRVEEKQEEKEEQEKEDKQTADRVLH